MTFNRNRSNYGSRTQVALQDNELRQIAPSIFAMEPWHGNDEKKGVSDRFTFIPTIDIVNKMRAEGFQVYKAAQSRTRIAGKGEFTKHQLRFRDVRNTESKELVLGGIHQEIVLTNGHDGSSSYELEAGLFRLVCLNGLTVSQGNVGHIRVRHTGGLDGVINASYKIVEDFPKVIEAAQTFGQLQLTAPQQNAFAEAALTLRYDEDERIPVTASQIIEPRRREDSNPSLWNTFNVVQEHLVNGGDRGTNAKGEVRKTRAVSSIAEQSKLNRALWSLTEKMKDLLN